jgi:hypothetical protein
VDAVGISRVTTSPALRLYLDKAMLKHRQMPVATVAAKTTLVAIGIREVMPTSATASVQAATRPKTASATILFTPYRITGCEVQLAQLQTSDDVVTSPPHSLSLMFYLLRFSRCLPIFQIVASGGSQSD